MKSDESYDELFERIEHLAHYPWVGNNYADAPFKLLILGDSHYTVDSDGKFCKEEYDRCLTDKFYTRDILDDAVGNSGVWNMFRGLYSLFDIIPKDAEEKLWAKIAFYSFVQTPMEQPNAKPSDRDFREAWYCLLDIIDIIKPDFCLFIGIRGWRSNGFINLEKTGKITLVDDEINGKKVKISRCTPWKADIETRNGVRTKAVAIHHVE